MTKQQSITTKMSTLVEEMESSSDRRAIFLSCYMRMTQNMVKAIEASEFNDPSWVSYLLERFADYYFDSLAVYDLDSSAASAVWQVAHRTAGEPKRLVLQNLLLGVNAHINYDLVLTLVDVLESEWPQLTAVQRQERQADYCRVNEIIRQTIDVVQDEVVAKHSPLMDVVDKLFGPLDEWFIAQLITNWRDEVWETAVLLMKMENGEERQQLINQVEAATLKRADAILFKSWISV